MPATQQPEASAFLQGQRANVTTEKQEQAWSVQKVPRLATVLELVGKRAMIQPVVK